ncbi:MAG: asparagine synthetase B [Planctomycetota bacterium]
MRSALAALRWRGPDGAGSVRCGDFVLGCARLAITERRSRQPLLRRGGRFAAVLNGAVTDARAQWRELRPRLLRRPSLPNDTWLPLLWCEAGRPERLGDFAGHRAVAVVDAVEDRLWLAQDPAGEKPLLVALVGGAPVAFASTAPALRALGVDAVVDDAGLARLFWSGAAGPPVGRPAGPRVVAALPRVHTAAGSGQPPVPVPARAAPEAAPPVLATALAAAVARCADAGADQPVGLALSGGIDSSCIAVELAGRRDGSAPTAWQFRAAGADRGERDLAAAVAAHLGLALRPVEGGPEVLDALPLLTRCAGLPLGDPSVLAVHALARKAAGAGVRVLLSGEGADEALLGYARHRALRRLPRWRLPAPPRTAADWSMGRVARSLRALAAADPYLELLAVTPPAFRREVLTAEIAAPGSTGPWGPWPGRPRGPAAERLQHAAAVDRDLYLRWDLLPKLDVATMAAAVEGRCPFLDGEVQRACAALSPLQRLGKRPLRAAYRDRLPAAVFAQPKRGFALPLDRWFRGDLPWLDLLRSARTRARPHLRPGGLDRAIDRHRRGAADLGHALYLVVAFELYLQSLEESVPCG